MLHDVPRDDNMILEYVSKARNARSIQYCTAITAGERQPRGGILLQTGVM